MKLLVFGLICGASGAGGYFAPSFLLPHPAEESSAAPARSPNAKPAFVAFGDVVVNLAEERLTRYLRVQLILVVDAADEKEFVEALPRNKAILRNWLISYLSDRSLKEVSGAAGVNRLRREILDQFNALLYPDGGEKIRDILFEQFNIQ